MRWPVLAMMLLPVGAMADGIKVENPVVPLAPPGVMAHAAYFTLTNQGPTARQLVGVSADGYGMAHIHKSEVQNDIATMSAVDMIEIAPGQSVSFEHGGFHVMLMRPKSPLSEGDTVSLTLDFADGGAETVTAVVTRLDHGS